MTCCKGLTPRPLFMPIRGAYLQQSHDFMEPRCVLLPLRTITAPADCTRLLLGNGRNRYVAAPAWSGTPGFVAQNNKSRLSVTANKSCLNGWPFKIWSCCPAPYGTGQPVCAASTGRVLQPAPGAAADLIVRREQYFGKAAPVFSPNYILVCRQDNMVGADGTLAPRPRKSLAKDNESHNHNRQSGHQKHRITKGSNSTGGGTAVTSPVSRTGGTELRLFHSWDLSVSRPTNRQAQSGPRRIEALRPAGFAAEGRVGAYFAPLSPTHRPNQLYEPPRRMGNATGARGGFSPGPFSVMMLRHYCFHSSCWTEAAPYFRHSIKNQYRYAQKSPRRLRRFDLQTRPAQVLCRSAQAGALHLRAAGGSAEIRIQDRLGQR